MRKRKPEPGAVVRGELIQRGRKGDRAHVRLEDGTVALLLLPGKERLPAGCQPGAEVEFEVVGKDDKGRTVARLNRHRFVFNSRHLAALAHVDVMSDWREIGSLAAYARSVPGGLAGILKRLGSPVEAERGEAREQIRSACGDEALAMAERWLKGWAANLEAAVDLLGEAAARCGADPDSEGFDHDQVLLLLADLTPRARRRGMSALEWLRKSPTLALATVRAPGLAQFRKLAPGIAEIAGVDRKTRLLEAAVGEAVHVLLHEANEWGHTWMAWGALKGQVLGILKDVNPKEVGDLLYEAVIKDRAPDGRWLRQRFGVPVPIYPCEKGAEGGYRVTLDGTSWGDRMARIVGEMAAKMPVAAAKIAAGGADLAGLDEEQALAVKRAFENPVSVITGCAGTGKTLALARIISLASNAGIPVVAVAPTGRAAQAVRIAAFKDHAHPEFFDREGRLCGTIHRVFSVDPEEADDLSHNPAFRRFRTPKLNEDLPDGSRAAVIIVDEVSMLPQNVFGYLATAVSHMPVPVHLVFCGDDRQLPAVGPGAVLRDLIAFLGERGCVTRLKKIHRTIPASRFLAESASKYVMENCATLDYDGSVLRRVEVSSGDAGTVFAKAADLALEWQEELGEDNVLVLTPLREGPAGCVALGRMIRERLGREEDGKGSLVVCTRNTYSHEAGTVGITDPYSGQWMPVDLFNGERGRVASKDGDKAQLDLIDRGGTPVLVNVPWHVYRRRFEDGHALTVHRSQGTEAKAVILALPDEARFAREDEAGFVTRNLIYTGITRAMERVAVVGSSRALEAVNKAAFAPDRRTRMVDELKKGYNRVLADTDPTTLLA